MGKIKAKKWFDQWVNNNLHFNADSFQVYGAANSSRRYL